MFIEIKLTFKSVSLVRIKNYLSIFNKNMENIFLGIGGIYKIIYFFLDFLQIVLQYQQHLDLQVQYGML